MLEASPFQWLRREAPFKVALDFIWIKFPDEKAVFWVTVSAFRRFYVRRVGQDIPNPISVQSNARRLSDWRIHDFYSGEPANTAMWLGQRIQQALGLFFRTVSRVAAVLPTKDWECVLDIVGELQTRLA